MKFRYLVVFVMFFIFIKSASIESSVLDYPGWVIYKIEDPLILKSDFIRPVITNPVSVQRLDPLVYIDIKNFKFMPYELNITPNTTVVWVNNDWTGSYGRLHILAAHYNRFRSPRLGLNHTFNHTFTQKGVYTYINPLYRSVAGGAFMKGIINVV
ncbi:MAG: hypothetical protein ABIC04_05735 [Nanoarchaeota archaeon]